MNLLNALIRRKQINKIISFLFSLFNFYLKHNEVRVEIEIN